MKPKRMPLALFQIYNRWQPQALIHPAQYAQGYNALFAIQGSMSREQFRSLDRMAQGRYIQETDVIYRLFPVSSTPVFLETIP